MTILVALLLLQAQAVAESISPGQIVADVKCAADPSQSYALYLPSGYSRERAWPVIFGLDPGARGRVPVERYQAAAEEYGFIVAGSNNSRNGSPDVTRAVTAMVTDVLTRFHIDQTRVYFAGMSGGARVALSFALGSPNIAGVIASSAGFPDGKPRKTVTFPLFATAGTEDFNLLEMRRLDRELTSPHHLVVFEGGHVWLSSELATRAVEWLELQAMKRGVQPRDDKKIDRIYGKWSAGIDESRVDKSSYIAVQGLASTFDGLKDVSALQARAAALGREKAVRDALKRDRDDDAREERWYEDMRTLETRLQADDDRPRVLMELRRRWKELADGTKSPEDTPDRRLARRVLASLSSGVTTTDAEYLKIISEYRVGRGGRR